MSAVLATLNAPRARAMNAGDLRDALREPGERWRAHLEALLDEVSDEMLHRLVLCGFTDFAALSHVQRTLAYRGCHADWIDEMAHDRVA